MDSFTSNATTKKNTQAKPITVQQSDETHDMPEGIIVKRNSAGIVFVDDDSAKVMHTLERISDNLQKALYYLEDALHPLSSAEDLVKKLSLHRINLAPITQFVQDVNLTYDIVEAQAQLIDKHVENLKLEGIVYMNLVKATQNEEIIPTLSPEERTKLVNANQNIRYNAPGKAIKHNPGNDIGSHTHETCMQNTSQLNSRMMTLSTGMTNFSSQMAIPACYAYGADFSCTEDLLPPCDDPTQPGPGVNRYVLIGEETWSQTQTAGTRINHKSFPQDLISATPENLFAATAKRHKLVRSGYSVIVSCNPSRFHQGNLLAVMIPEAEKATFASEPQLNVNQLMLYPHQFLNLRSTDAVCINVPFVSANPIDIVETHNNWTLALVVVAPLSVVVETPQQSLVVKILVAPVNPSFHGLLETRALYNAPPMQVSNNVGAAATVGDGMTSQTLAQVNEEDMPIEYLPPPVMSLLEMARIPTMISNNTRYGFEWSSAMNSGDPLYSFPVTLNPDEEPFEGTYIADLASLFSQWNGTLDLDLMFSGTINHQGRLCVAFIPNTQFSNAVTMASAMEATYTIWDIGSNSTLHFPIPYIAQTHWRNVYSTTTATSLTSYIGQISIFVYNPLTGPSNVPQTTEIIAFASGNTDFSLRLPSINAFEYNAPEDEPSTELTQLEAGEVSAEKPEGVWDGASRTVPERSKDTDVSSFYARSRYYASAKLPGSGSAEGEPLAVALPLTCLSKAGNRQTLQAVLDSLFTYIKADVRVLGNVQFVKSNSQSTGGAGVVATGTVAPTSSNWLKGTFINPAGQTAAVLNQSLEAGSMAATLNIPALNAGDVSTQSVYQVAMTNIPPGGNYKTVLTAAIHNLQAAMPTMYSSMGSNTSNQSVYVPYQSPYNVLPCFYDGYSSADKTVYGQLNNNVFGTLLISYSSPDESEMAIYTSYHNAKFFLPRPFPPHKTTTFRSTVAKTTDVVIVQSVRGLSYNGEKKEENVPVEVEEAQHSEEEFDLIDFLDYGWEESRIPQPIYPDEVEEVYFMEEDDMWTEMDATPIYDEDDDLEIDGPLHYNGPCLGKPKIHARFECSVDVIDAKKSEESKIEYNSASTDALCLLMNYDVNTHFIPGNTFVSRYVRGTYTHWAISNAGFDISLIQDGLDAVVGMRPAEAGRIVHVMVNDTCWFHAIEMCNTKFQNYSAFNNCTHFCELITGETLTNTGTWMVAGMMIGAAAAVISAGTLLFNGPEQTHPGSNEEKTSVYHDTRAEHLQMEREIHQSPVNFTPRSFVVPKPILPIHNAGYYRALRAMAKKNHDLIFSKDMSMKQIAKELGKLEYNGPKKGIVETLEEAAASVKDAGISASVFTDKLDGILTPELVKEFKDTITGIKDASLSTQETLKAVQGALKCTTETLATGFKSAMSTIAQTVISFICKIVGWCLIIFSNPCPGVIAGLAMCLAGEVFGNPALSNKIMDTAVSMKEKFLALIEHTAQVPAGTLKPDEKCPPLNEDEIQKAHEEEQVQFADVELLAKSMKISYNNKEEKSSIIKASQDFNTLSTTARNIDWIITKIKDFIEWLLGKFTDYKKQTPDYKLSQKHDDIVTMYRNAIYSGDIQNVDEEAVKKETDAARELFSMAIACKNTTYISMLRETIKLNLDILRKIKNTKFAARAEPVVCLFWGKPGCGKSVACNKLAKLACDERGLNSENHIFSMPPKSEYFDGYTGQFCHVIDDLGNDSTGTDYDCFLQMVSTCPFKPALADLKEKGITYQSEIIYASSNFRDACPPTVRCHKAIERRIFAKCEVILNPKYAIEPSEEDKKYKEPVLDFAHANANCGPCPEPFDEYFMYDTAIMNGDAFKCRVSIAGGATKEMNLYQIQHLVDEEHARRQRQALAADDVFRSAHGHTPKARLQVSKKFTKDDFEIKSIVSGLNLGMGTAAEAADATNPNNPRLHFNAGDDKAVPTSVVNENFKTNQELFEEASVKARFITPEDSAVLDTDPEVLKIAADTKADPELLKTMAAKLDRNSKITMWCTILGALAGLIGLVTWFFSSRKTKANGAYGKIPGMLQTQKVAKAPLTPVGMRYNQMPQIYQKVERNIYSVTAHYHNKKDETLSCLGICDRVYAVNHHLIKNCHSLTIRGFTIPCTAAKGGRVYHNHCASDLYFVTLPVESPAVTDIRRLLLTQGEEPTAAKAILMVRTQDRHLDMMGTDIQVLADTVQVDEDSVPNCFVYNCLATFGHCGGPILATTKKNREFIAGIHIASDSQGMSIGVRITREDVEKYMNAKPTFEDGMTFPVYNGLRLETTTEVKPVFAMAKTALEPSPAYGAFPILKEPAVLRASDKRLNTCLEGAERREQFEQGIFGKLARDTTIPWKNMQVSTDLYIEKLRKLIPKKLQPISQHEAINGIPGLDGLDMNQSPGYPYTTEGITRRALFVQTPDGYVPKERLQEDIDAALNDPSSFYFTSFLKDELRTKEKVASGATRVVEGDSLPRIIAMRMVFGNLFAVFNSNPGFATGSAVGCNPDVHWTGWYHALARKANVYDLDYKNFDGSLPSCAFDMLAFVLSSFVDVEQCIVRQFTDSIKNSYHVWNGKLYNHVGGMPSGCVGTSVFNSILNNIFVQSAFLSINPEYNPDEVLILTYGDDVVYGTDQKLLPRDICEFYKYNTTLTVTPGNKTGDWKDTSDIHSVTFLKRWFVPDPEHPYLCHPVIDPAVYEQSAMWVRGGDFQDTITSLCQLAFHSGPLNYAAWVKAVRAQIQKNKHSCRYSFLPFSFLQSRWLANFNTQ
ncbi:polyprotein [pemapivirus B1]|uniref:Genome polyprotein n=1 Tax=pemapivirus B1 TaxID=2870355 RepID=A0A2P1GN48_9PICO|nr:polyprotein [pemapivirus B1]AVM87423.1 polyprotein [pemapivirus B1]